LFSILLISLIDADVSIIFEACSVVRSFKEEEEILISFEISKIFFDFNFN
jgi:hypothetical protein